MIGETISTYQILEEIGSGGMGIVYKAKDLKLGRFIALKFLSGTLSDNKEAKERFFQEAKAAAALNHQNICTIYEVAEVEGSSFIAMEYIQGESLRDRIIRKSLDITEVVDITFQIAKGLKEAHAKGIVHRDIKSANIMLTESGQAKITDFGLAKLSGDSFITKEDTTMGTVSYMSPEQIRGKNVDHRTDLWSLGVLIYEMMTGELPFAGEADQAVIFSIMNEEPDYAHFLNSTELKKLQPVISKLLEKNLNARYQHIDDFLLDLLKISPKLPSDSLSKLLTEITPRWKRILAAGKTWFLFILLIAIIIMAIKIYSLFTTNNFSERDWLLITDFENYSGEKLLDGTVAEAISIDLNQSNYLNIFPRQRITEVLKRMEKTDIETIDEEIGREICIREGIKAMLVGSISTIGTNYFLGIKILNPITGEAIVTERIEASTNIKIFEAVDSLSRTIRSKLGESLSSIREMDKPLEKVTTSSLQALQYFSIGRELGARAEWNDAIPFYKKAIEEDSTFASAYAHLGVIYHNMGDINAAQLYSSLALKWINKVTEREKYYIEAEYYRYRNQYKKSIENYIILTKLYPDDFTSYSNLAFIYQFTREYDKAIAPLKEAARISPNSWYVYQNFGLNYGGLGEMDLAKQNFLTAVQMNPNQNWSYCGLSVVFLIEEDLNRALEQVERLFQSGETWESIGYEWRAASYRYFGKYDKALKQLEEGIRVDHRSQDLSRETSKYLVMADIYFQKEDTVECIKAINKSTELWLTTYYIMKSGIIYARSNLEVEALKAVQEFEDRIKNDETSIKLAEYYRLLGEIELAKNNLDEAINFLENSKSLENNLETRFSLGMAYKRKGDFEKANLELQYISKNKWATLFDGVPYLWPISQYHIGHVYELKDEGVKSQKYYQNFIDIWQDADSDIKEVKDIRRKKLEKVIRGENFSVSTN
jgi:tetratricopeptide (TPR) repeat protein